MHVQNMENQFDSYVRALDSLEKLDVQLAQWVQAMENYARYEQRQVARLERLVASSKSPGELVRMRDQRIASLQKLAREIEHARSIRDRGTAAFG
jgi:hypothetical protein